MGDLELNRREFIAATAATGALATLPTLAHAAAPHDSDTPPPPPTPQKAQTKMHGSFQINGKKTQAIEFDTRVTLLDLLREELHLTGAKKGCDHGQCGACTVIVDGHRINSCLSLAAQNIDRDILTIEGLADGERLHPMQEAFIEHDAFQCGFCTPGQIMSAVALLKEPCGSSESEVRECMSGNICRCGAYRNILDAIADVRSQSHHHVETRS